MKKKYSSNYSKIYSWKAFSIVLNMFSMLIVIPQLTSNPTIYGIYMLCVSTAFFLSYADIGFIGAGFKYSAEYYAKGDLENEIKMQGFVNFILAVFVFIFFLLYITLSFYPSVIIKDISNQFEVSIASKLLLIQGIFSFSIVIQRINNTAFGIRLEDYNLQKIMIMAYSIKILSIFYFFRSAHYDIVGYFLFGKSVELIAGLVGILFVKLKYHYSLSLLLKSFRFSKNIYNKTKQLAIASFYNTIMFMLFYELDSIVISKYLGAQALAYFAIGLTITRFFRSFFSMIYGPVQARFNHFIGLKDDNGLRKFYIKVLQCTMPLVVFPIISVLVLRKPLVLSWVGSDYLVSVNILFFLVITSIFTFNSTPAYFMIIALEKVKQLYLISTVTLITYWVGIILTIKYWQVESFAIFKFISVILADIFYLSISLKFLKMNLLQLIRKIILPFVIPLSFLIVSLFIIEPYLPVIKDNMSILLVVFSGGIASLISMVLYYLISREFRLYTNNMFNDSFVNIKKLFLLKEV